MYICIAKTIRFGHMSHFSITPPPKEDRHACSFNSKLKAKCPFPVTHYKHTFKELKDITVAQIQTTKKAVFAMHMSYVKIAKLFKFIFAQNGMNMSN